MKASDMKYTCTQFADLAREIQIPEDGILTRTLHDDDQVKCVLFGFSPEQELSEHTASVPAILHFLQGEASVTLDDQQTTAGEGTWIHMPANCPHSIHARSPVLMLLLMLKCKDTGEGS